MFDFVGVVFLAFFQEIPIMTSVMKRNALRALGLLILSLGLEIAGETLPGALWTPTAKDNVTWTTLS